MTKKEIFATYTPPVFDMGTIYGKVIMIMFTTCFYAPLLPIALIYTIIGLTFYFWVTKVIYIYINLVYFIKKKKC